MEACEDAISNTARSNTFKSGYCFGVYHAASTAHLFKLGTLGKDYCPTDPNMKADVYIGIVAKRIRDHPIQWYTGEVYNVVVLAMKEAYPCE